MLEKARSVEAKTARERDWIEAIRAYFRDHEKVPVDTRLLAYNKAMRELAERYPDDFEAQVYYALTLQASAPKSDLTYANQFKSAEMLEKLYAQNPQHPGITHYLIHAYDFAPFAEKGIPAARRYAAIAPAVPHARHMPAHIYSMAGLWEDSIASNLSALEIQPDYYHAADFTVYAHLQLAQDAQGGGRDRQGAEHAAARRSAANGRRLHRPRGYAGALCLERARLGGRCSAAGTSTGYPQADSLTRFTRGLGMARIGRARDARLEIDALQDAQRKAREGGRAVLGRSHAASRCWRCPRGSRSRKARATGPSR